MASAAFIAARKALLSELLAAHIEWRDDVVNPAITKLNAAKASDPGLQSLADVLTPAVLKINLYRPELDRLIAETDAMVPDPDPPPPPPPPPGSELIIPPQPFFNGEVLRVNTGNSATTWPKLISRETDISWRKGGGDWWDKDGTLNGSNHWAVARVERTNVEQPVTWDCTELVRAFSRLVSPMENRGLLLKRVGGTAAAGREDWFSSRDPEGRGFYMDVDGERYGPIVDHYILSSSIIPNPRPLLLRTGNIDSGVLYFDLRALRGRDITRAELHGRSPSQIYSGYSLIAVCPVAVMFNAITPRLDGIASILPLDAGLKDHPDVLMFQDFAHLTQASGTDIKEMDMQPHGWTWRTQEGARTKLIRDSDPASPLYHPLAPGVPCAKLTVPTGFNLGVDAEFRFGADLGFEPDECFIRSYIMLGDFDSTGGGKLPVGFDGQYNRQGSAINGVFVHLKHPVTGRYWCPPDAPPTMHRPATGRGGWVNFGGYLGRDDTSVAAAGYRASHSYIYHVDQSSPTGDHWEWRIENQGLFKQWQWYCLDRYFRCNSVQDDGVGLRDGADVVWANSRLAFEKYDVRMRHWPEGPYDIDPTSPTFSDVIPGGPINPGQPQFARNIKIHGYLGVHYHGGLPPATSPVTFYVTHMCAARRYIGPAPGLLME